VSDEAMMASSRLAGRLWMPRNSHPRPEEGEMKDDRGMESIAVPESSWE